ncbi:MAG: recombinase family protein [Actinomycetota bacterium]|nr:recombinase family protein [Actinomycetota bacterium]
MWRVAIYAREAPGHAGRRRLQHQIARLGTQVARQPGWRHVASYADQPASSSPWERPGLARLLVEAPGRVDLVVVDSYGRLSANRYELTGILDRLRWSGVAVVVLLPSRARRLAKLVANLALADLVGEAGR